MYVGRRRFWYQPQVYFTAIRWDCATAGFLIIYARSSILFVVKKQSVCNLEGGCICLRVDRHMEELCQAGCAKRTAIAIGGGEMYS